MLLTYFLNDFEIVPVASIITGITFVFTFHTRSDYHYYHYYYYYVLHLCVIVLELRGRTKKVQTINDSKSSILL